MRKTEKYILAVLFIVFGVAFIVLKTDFIGILTTVLGLGLITLGVLDAIKGLVLPAVLKILFGLIIAVCGWFLVEAVFYVISAVLLGLGGYFFYTTWQENNCTDGFWGVVCNYALPTLSIVIGLLLLFHQTALMNLVFVLCGILTVVAGVVLWICAFQEEN